MADSIKGADIPVRNTLQYALGFDASGNWGKMTPAKSAAGVEETAEEALAKAEAAQTTANRVEASRAGSNTAGLAVGMDTSIEYVTSFDAALPNIMFGAGMGSLAAKTVKPGVPLFSIISGAGGIADPISPVVTVKLNGAYGTVPTVSGIMEADVVGWMTIVSGTALLVNLSNAGNRRGFGVFLSPAVGTWLRIPLTAITTVSAVSADAADDTFAGVYADAEAEAQTVPGGPEEPSAGVSVSETPEVAEAPEEEGGNKGDESAEAGGKEGADAE